MLNSFECKELENIYKADKRHINLFNDYIYSFTLNDDMYLSNLKFSYLFWYKVYEIAKLQFFNNRLVNCVFDNSIKYHHAINYVINLIRKDLKK